MTTLLELERVSKTYDGTPAVREVSLQIAQGEMVALLGPSGCGKTTLLRVIAGLETPDAGVVRFGGQDMAGVPAHRRGFGLMFQDYALFPHRDVAQNVAFGLEMQGWDRARIIRRVSEMLELVGLKGYERRRVFELSGGEQQRVALARSLAPQPRLLMLDEPLGSLDRALREQLLEELRRILRQVGVTTIYVTHDQQEAFALADRVVILRAGRVVQEGMPEEVYCHPVDSFVAYFLGLPNLIPGRVVGPEHVETALGTLIVSDAGGCASGERVTVLIRPEAAVLAVDRLTPNVVRGRVLDRSFRGSHYHVRMACGDDITLELDVRPLGQPLPAPGEEIALSLQPAGLSLLAECD
ncbi:MAG: ABC transporter ATP-binding protein [Anaerolineae bacterium]|nr:ABC transporter ATP-binding protein [Anaerolineae bacterium]MDW8098194.1 ABC transporter ATP-binding protein [Anaerolineae bacterium]